MPKKSKLSPKRIPKRSLDILQRYEIPEAADFLRISRTRLYGHIGSGLISTIKEGKRIFVPGSEIARLSALPAAR